MNREVDEVYDAAVNLAYYSPTKTVAKAGVPPTSSCGCN
jgi:hypothetical protein